MTDPMQDKALTPARMQAIQARLHPARFLQRFSALLERDGDEILETLFALAKGNWESDANDPSKRVLRSDPKDIMAAIRLIKDMGAFDEVVKHLMRLAHKGRPNNSGPDEIEPWVADYADALPDDPPPPPKKPR